MLSLRELPSDRREISGVIALAVTLGSRMTNRRLSTISAKRGVRRKELFATASAIHARIWVQAASTYKQWEDICSEFSLAPLGLFLD